MGLDSDKIDKVEHRVTVLETKLEAHMSWARKIFYGVSAFVAFMVSISDKISGWFK